MLKEYRVSNDTRNYYNECTLASILIVYSPCGTRKYTVYILESITIGVTTRNLNSNPMVHEGTQTYTNVHIQYMENTPIEILSGTIETFVQYLTNK